MDEFDAKKRIYEGMGEYAREQQLEEMKRLYGKPASEPVPGAEDYTDSADAALDSVSMPNADEMKPGVETLGMVKGQGPENEAMADDMAAENQNALAGLDEDLLRKLLAQK